MPAVLECFCASVYIGFLAMIPVTDSLLTGVAVPDVWVTATSGRCRHLIQEHFWTEREKWQIAGSFGSPGTREAGECWLLAFPGYARSSLGPRASSRR
jgi:hypothetical protein